jgi:hypothetical protein
MTGRTGGADHLPDGEPPVRVTVVLPDGSAAVVASTDRLDADVVDAATGLQAVVTTEPGDGDGDGGWDVRVDVTHGGAVALDASIRVTVPLGASSDPDWLVPGAFYGENRPAENDRVFPRFAVGASAPADHAAFVSDRWEFRSDRAATPVAFGRAEAGSAGWALSGPAVGPLGMTGIGFGHHDGQAEVHLTSPYREGPVSYHGDADPRPADVTSHRFRPGDRVTLRFRVHALSTDRHAYAPVLRRLRDDAVPSAPLRPWVDVAEAADIAAEGLLRWHYDPDPGVLLETVGFDREVTGRDGRSVDRQAMHVGWVSGVPWAVALLRHGTRTGTPSEVEAARRVIDLIAANRSPSGTLWGTWYRASGWGQSWTPVARGLHSRTLAEATLFLVRALEVEPDHPSWADAVRADLDHVVARQRADGDPGALHDAETGEVLSWRGQAGLTWIPALLAAAAHPEHVGQDRAAAYRTAAERAGAFYAAAVEAEWICGAPEDVDLAPTSEDGYAAVMAYVSLWEATGTGRWLDLARRAADWMLTFRYTYDVAFPPRSPLGTYDFGTRGADQASSSNQHLHAYGLVCTRELRALADALGDPWYAERADETLACFRQFLPREDGDVNAYRGMVTERYYQTACFQPKGMVLTLSHAWSAGVLLLACEDTIAAGLA